MGRMGSDLGFVRPAGGIGKERDSDFKRAI